MAMQGVTAKQDEQIFQNDMSIYVPNAQHYAAYQAKYQRYQRLVNALKQVDEV